MFEEYLSNLIVMQQLGKNEAVVTMVLKTKPSIEPFFSKFPVQPQFLIGFSVFGQLLTGFEAFKRTGLNRFSRLNQSVQSGF